MQKEDSGPDAQKQISKEKSGIWFTQNKGPHKGVALYNKKVRKNSRDAAMMPKAKIDFRRKTDKENSAPLSSFGQ